MVNRLSNVSLLQNNLRVGGIVIRAGRYGLKKCQFQSLSIIIMSNIISLKFKAGI